jgi:hypothetical protein
VSRKPFNWSLLDRASLYTMLYKLKPVIVGQEFHVNELQKLLRSHIKQHLPVKVTMKKDHSYQPKQVYIGGAYYADHDISGKQHIEIVFGYNAVQETVKITATKWKRICVLFADTVLHEIIHLRQYRSRSFKYIPGYLSTAYYAKDRKEQEYYGHKDEMGAFAFNIACELYDQFSDNFDIAKLYLDSNAVKKRKKTCWYRLLKSFDYDHNHPIIRKLKRKILKNLPYAKIGKPFKTDNWLTY